MPKRDDAKAQQETAPVAETKETPKTSAPKADAGAKAGTKKFPLIERVKKFFDKVSPELNENIFEINEQNVEQDGHKNKCVFVVFTDKTNAQAEGSVVEEKNVELIKEVLFGYHTLADAIPPGKALEVGVMSPKDEDGVHILCIQEF